MKQLFYLIMLPLLCISCGDNDKETLAYISLEQDKITFEHSGGYFKINLETDGGWQTSNIPDWISLDHTNGSKSTEITVTALSNENTEPRDTEIYFLRDNKKTILKIHQLNKEKELTWSRLCFSSFDDVGFTPGKNKDERIYSFTTKELFINPDVNTDIKEKIFLGNLINRNLDKNIDLSVYNGYTFNPITVFSLTGTEKSQTFIPSKSEQDAYANKILDKNPSQNEAFISDGEGITYNSHRELNLIGTGNMGINLDKVISGKSYREKEMTKKNGLIYSFSNKLFTLSMDLEEHIVKEKINKKDFPDNSISFISSVSYGRIGLLIIESNNDITKIRAVVNKIMQSNIGKITQEDAAVLKELDAYHLYYNKSQKLVITKGNIDIIEAYKTQITDDIYNVFPFKINISDYFEHSLSSMNYKVTLP